MNAGGEEHAPLAGCLIGTAVGDAIGLPFEGLSKRRVRAILGDGPLTHRFLLGRGCISDDTEHALMTADAWARADGDVDRFRQLLARRLRLWMLCLPPATGLATAKSCARLLLGFPSDRSGVHSAGNGPVMRAPVLGVLCDSDELLQQAIRAASRISHTDPRAEHGALAIALAASVMSAPTQDLATEFESRLTALVPDGDMRSIVLRAVASARNRQPVEVFVAEIGCEGAVSGFVMHTVPVVLRVWLEHPADYAEAIELIVRLGGDTDSTAAALGGIIGARHTPPDDWTRATKDFPTSIPLLRRTAESIANARPSRLSPRWLAQPARNLVFLLVVLVHAGRRALPPYR